MYPRQLPPQPRDYTEQFVGRNSVANASSA